MLQRWESAIGREERQDKRKEDQAQAEAKVRHVGEEGKGGILAPTSGSLADEGPTQAPRLE